LCSLPACKTRAVTPPPEVTAQQGFERALQSVVRIDVREMTFENGATNFISGVGSGVIISDDGLVITNAHVASPRAVEITVTLPNLEWVRATLVGWDHWTDLAVLRLDIDELKRRGLAFAHADFGDSTQLKPTQTVFAVGTPFGLTRTVTKGIISNTDRYFEASDGVRGYETGYFNTWLQHDAPISPGNSGGPLVTEDGHVVGINSRVYLGGENLGFAIPANTARDVLTKIVATGRVERSYIGVVPGALRDLEHFYELTLNTGMLVNSVDPGSPAARAGLRPGDIVLSINESPIDGRFPEQLPPIQNLIANQPIGSELTLVVKRSGHELPVRVVTEPLASRVGDEWAFEKWGMSVRKVSRAFARENRLPNADGVIVIGTQPAYPAEKAGLARGDIITSLNSQKIEHLDQLKEIYSDFEKNPDSLLVEALHNSAVSLFVLKP
jgi:serine protease Do